MINKIYKIIHNKYSRFLKFFFFLRHVFAIFVIGIFLFLLIPKFFNYEKKQEIIKEYLVNYYDLELSNYSSIEFNVFPLPNLSIKNINLKVKDQPIFFNTKNLNIFLNFKNIYNYENFVAKKILLNNNRVDLDIDTTHNILNYFGELKYKLDIQDLNLNFKKKENSILEIKKIDFSNYGYKKNRIKGEIFDKKFKAYLSNDNKNLNFKILNTGIKADFHFDKINKINSISGSSKISILKNHLRFGFVLQDNQIEITKSNLRNQDLSISFDSFIVFDPFFEINSDIYINKIDKKLINSFSLEKILKNQEILKKLNNNSKVNYNNKRLFNTLIKNHSSELNLAHGRLTFLSKIYILGGDIDCKGESLLIEEYPRLDFVCLFNLENKKKLLKKFSISKNINQDPVNLNVEGSLNLLNKKINFKKINIDKSYVANEIDMKYFKETFENILFDDDFFGIFRMNKIKEFLLEVI
jgi:hypothetical protein